MVLPFICRRACLLISISVELIFVSLRMHKKWTIKSLMFIIQSSILKGHSETGSFFPWLIELTCYWRKYNDNVSLSDGFNNFSYLQFFNLKNVEMIAFRKKMKGLFEHESFEKLKSKTPIAT